MIPRTLKTGLLLSAALGLAACEDGVPRNLNIVPSGGVTVATYDGLWAGVYTGSPPGEADQWGSTFIAMIHSGRMLLYEDNGQVWDGNFNLTSSAAMRSPDVSVLGRNDNDPRDHHRVRSTRIVIDGALIGDLRLDMRYDLGPGVGPVTMTYDRNLTAYQRSSSLALLAGVWTLASDDEGAPALSLTINDTGFQAVLDGMTANSCHYNGTIDLIDPSRNLYAVNNFVVTNGEPGACDVDFFETIREPCEDDPERTCTRDELRPRLFTGDDYTGLASLVPGQNTLLIVVTNALRDRAIPLKLVRGQG